MIIYLYGLPAVGKNFIGELLKERYGFYFQDADKYLPKEMKFKLQKGIHFTIDEVAHYHDIIACKILQLKIKHNNLVITQASLFKDHRKKIKELNPLVNFILIKADLKTVLERLKKRKGLVTKEYAKDLQKYLQISDKDPIIFNNKNQSNHTISKQIEKLFPELKHLINS